MVSEILNNPNNKIEAQINSQMVQDKKDLRLVYLKFTSIEKVEDGYTEWKRKITIYEDICKTED